MIRFVLISLIACGACAGEPPLGAPVDGRLSVSAGLRRVVFDSLPAGGAIVVDRRPDLILGGTLEVDSLEFNPRGQYLPVTTLAGGSIVVGDHQRLLWFDSTGRFMRTIARAGNGPGEFDQVRDLCPLADGGLLTVDQDGRLSQWDGGGQLVRTVARLGIIPYHACAASGDVLVRDDLDAAIDSTGRRTAAYRLAHADGTPAISIGRLLASEPFIGFGFDPWFAFTDTSLLVADSRTAEISERALRDGRPNRSWRVSGLLRPVSESTYDSIVASGIPTNASPAQRERTLQRSKEIGNPGAMPAFFDMRWDAAGRIWLNPAFDHLTWYVIHGDGAELSRVRLPQLPNAKLTGFVKGHVVMRYTNEDGSICLGFFPIRTTAA